MIFISLITTGLIDGAPSHIACLPSLPAAPLPTASSPPSSLSRCLSWAASRQASAGTPNWWASSCAAGHPNQTPMPDPCSPARGRHLGECHSWRPISGRTERCRSASCRLGPCFVRCSSRVFPVPHSSASPRKQTTLGTLSSWHQQRQRRQGFKQAAAAAGLQHSRSGRPQVHGSIWAAALLALCTDCLAVGAVRAVICVSASANNHCRVLA
jgi:hypothetical protein